MRNNSDERSPEERRQSNPDEDSFGAVDAVGFFLVIASNGDLDMSFP